VANYYTQFCFGIELGTSEQKEWWASVETYHECEESCPEDCPKVNEDHNGAGIDIDVSEAEVYFTAEEGGDVDWLAETIQKFLLAFNLDTVVTFTWACTCSKMRADAFGGGVYAVSRLGTKGIGAFALADEYADELRAQLAASVSAGT